MTNTVLPNPFLGGKGDKFFSNRIKNDFFLFLFLNVKFVFRKV